ncbi:hypothetical protein H8Z79_03610 [Blautia sp. 2744]|uniref:Prophage tail endopeptidase domain-containing protein n=1 Tax=Blautia intestinalis TaxID=2763028 RepID=A0ABR7HZ81_9FIRM|nr:hypothetical protein [Blautia intestinalis]MBC5739557.1 hypothetical protein [Blautia intestinalis]
MINASVEFRKTMRQRTDFKPSASILFADGRMVNLTEHDFSINGNELTDGAESNSFPLGVAIGRAFSMEIRNQDQRFEDYSFYLATVQLQLHFKLDSGTEETIYLGKCTITTPETYGTTITVQAVDGMYKANKSYSTQLKFPVTLGEMVRDCCLQCGLPLGSATFKNSNFSIKSKPENISCREVLAQAAMIAGGYAKVDRNGYLQICSYDLSIFEREGMGYGGSFDNSENAEFYVDGDNIDGGNFDDYSSGNTFDSGTFLSMDDFHMFYDFLSPPQTDADDVVITGIQITDTAGKTHLCGEEGYILSIENQLAKGNEQSAVNAIGKLINGFKFRAFSGEYIGYPLAEFGDICYVIDQNGNTYQSILTDITYRFNGKTSLKCSADSPLRNSSKDAYNSDYIKAVIAARNYTDQEMSAYDLVVQQMSQLAANTLGFHETKIIQDDGSVIVYRHDKPKLSESKIVYKSGIDGFFVTRSYTGKDSTTVWKAGFDSNGNAALNILSVIGIHWDWAYGGTLTLGGEDNKNGVLRILNANGAQIGKWDNTGADITGTVKTITSNGVYAKITGQDIAFINGGDDINEQVLMQMGAAISTDSNVADIDLGENTSFGIGGNGREMFQMHPYDDWTTKILGNFEVMSGTKSRVAETQNFFDRLLYCYETPTPMFGDVGCAQTNEEGVAIIDIDPVFAETISTGTEYQVFLQKEGPGDLWIQEKDESYFVVRGTPELKFSWELKCSQKHFEHLRLEEETQRTMVSKDINNAENDYSDIIDGLVNDYDTEMEELINESN